MRKTVLKRKLNALPPCLPDHQKYKRRRQRGSIDGVLPRSKKWWKRVFSYLIEVCILNAHNFQTFSNQTKVDFLQFHLNLEKQLIGTLKKSSRGRTQSVDHTKLLRLDSSPVEPEAG